MTYNDLVRHYGTAAACARRLGLQRQAVHRWQRFGIPTGRQYQIQVDTDGALMADAEQPEPEAVAA